MENITTEEVMDRLDIFLAIFVKVDKFGWWYLERIQTDAGTNFIYNQFQEGISVRGVRLNLSEPDHQEISDQVEVKCQTLQTIAHSIMVQSTVSYEYIKFALMYMTHHIFTILQIKQLVNQDGEPTIA